MILGKRLTFILPISKIGIENAQSGITTKTIKTNHNRSLRNNSKSDISLNPLCTRMKFCKQLLIVTDH